MDEMRATKGTVDAADVARFERLGADWWNSRGAMRALHQFNPQRVEWLVARMTERFLRQTKGHPVAEKLAGLTILDIGCGGGILSESLARHGAKVTGIDPAAGNVDIARRHAAEGGLEIDYRAVTAEELLTTGARFDVVCAMEVIEHVTDMRAFVAAAGALVRPGGLFFAATLNRTLKSFALAIVGAEYILGWVPRGTHQWEKFVTPQELEEAMELAGLEACDRTGVTYDPLRDQWLQSRDMAINYMMAATRCA